MKLCLVQQHPVDEERIPAAILRYVRLLDGLRDRGHDLVCVGPNERLRFEWDHFRGVRRLKVPTPGSGIKSLDMLFFACFLVPALLRLRRQEKPQLWFVDELFTAFGVCALRLRDRRTVIAYDIMGIHYYQVRKNNRSLLRHTLLSWLYGGLEKLTLWASTFLTTVNDAHRELLARWSARPCHTIRDACDVESFRVDQATPLPEKKAGELFLTFVGKISNRRLDELFRVLPAVFGELPGLRLVVVGNGPYFEHYRQEAQLEGLRGRVLFTDFVPHAALPAHIAQADITYSDDWSDIGFPMKVFEYMAMGAAILVEDTPAVREVMEDGRNCVLYRGEEGLAAGILRLARNEELRRVIGKRAREEARAEHGWEQRIRQFEECFERYATH